MAGVITAICRAFLARTLAAMNPRHGKSMAPHHGETARHGGVFAALLATIALLAAACSGSPGSHVAQPGSTTTQSNGALAFSQCMRSYGVPNWPAPTAAEGSPKETAQQLGVSSSQRRGCQDVLRITRPDRPVRGHPAAIKVARSGQPGSPAAQGDRPPAIRPADHLISLPPRPGTTRRRRLNRSYSLA